MTATAKSPLSAICLVGFLAGVVLSACAVTDYRNPELVNSRPDLASLETYVVASALGHTDRSETALRTVSMELHRLAEADAYGAIAIAYRAQVTHEAYVARYRARRDAVAYGLLVVLSAGLLWWFRRQEQTTEVDAAFRRAANPKTR